MSRLRKNEQIEIARYLDGELDAEATSRLEARVKREPALQDALREAEGLRRCFVAASGTAADIAQRATIGLADAVMQQAARLPRRKDLERLVDGEELEAAVLGFGRRVAAAAALLLGLALVIGLSCAQPAEDTSLKAVENKIRQIDERALDAMKKGLGKSETGTSSTRSGK